VQRSLFRSIFLTNFAIILFRILFVPLLFIGLLFLQEQVLYEESVGEVLLKLPEQSSNENANEACEPSNQGDTCRQGRHLPRINRCNVVVLDLDLLWRVAKQARILLLH